MHTSLNLSRKVLNDQEKNMGKQLLHPLTSVKIKGGAGVPARPRPGTEAWPTQDLLRQHPENKEIFS